MVFVWECVGNFLYIQFFPSQNKVKYIMPCKFTHDEVLLWSLKKEEKTHSTLSSICKYDLFPLSWLDDVVRNLFVARPLRRYGLFVSFFICVLADAFVSWCVCRTIRACFH